MDDKRKEKRFLYQTLVKYEDNEKFEQFDVVSINLSSEGISIVSDIDMDIGARFDLKFKLLKRDKPISAECKVIHKREFQGKHLIGCKIVKLEEIDNAELKKILEETFSKIDI